MSSPTTDRDKPSDPRPQQRPRTVAASPIARAVLFTGALGAFFFLLWALGPIDLFGGRGPAGRFFIAVSLPIIGAAWLYDPIVRRIDRRLYPEDYRPKKVSAARSERRASRSKRPRRVARRPSTPYLYALGTFVFAGAVQWIVAETGLIDTSRGFEYAYVFLVASFFAAFFLYDPILDFLEERFGAANP